MTAAPDILLIVSDQHAPRFAGCHGDRFGVTPNLDRLAARGVVFDNAYCPSPICLPSRMSLLTGKDPHRHRCWTNDDALPSDEPTYAHALGAAGYRPELIGRMHIIGPDQLHGFTARPIGDHNANWPGAPGVDHGVLAGTAGPDVVSLQRSGPGCGVYEMKDEAVAGIAAARLRELGAARQAGDRTPFALTVGFMLPHPPYVVNPEDYAAIPPEAAIPRLPPPASWHPALAAWREATGIDGATAADRARARRAYYGLVRKLDRLAGRVLGALEAAGLADDTLVIYTSDHGDHAGDRGLFWKHTFHDDSAKVPLIMAWPGHLPEGERRAAVCSLVDLAPTLIEAAGAPPLPGIDGASLLGVARDPAAPWLDETFSEYGVDPGQAYGGGHCTVRRMVRDGRWKLIWHDDGPAQLFDLAADPDELSDRAADPACAAIVARLTRRVLAGWDPGAIRAALIERHTRKEVWRRWAHRTSPADTHRWSVPAHERIWVDAAAD